MPVVNDSTQLGFIQESGPEVLEDPGLTDIIQQMVVGVTGLDKKLVRPRWQPTPPNQPPASTTWCSVGIVRRMPDDYPFSQHTSTNGVGQDTLTDWSRFDVLASFYGPNASAEAGRLRRGVHVEQNRDTLNAAGIKLRCVDDINSVPDLFNQQFVDHVDVFIHFAREVTSVYNIRDISSAEVDFNLDTGVSITVVTDLTTPGMPFILDIEPNDVLDGGRVM